MGGVRPTQGHTLAVMQGCGGSQSFTVVNALRMPGRWMSMVTISNQSFVANAWQEIDDNAWMDPTASQGIGPGTLCTTFDCMRLRDVVAIRASSKSRRRTYQVSRKRTLLTVCKGSTSVLRSILRHQLAARTATGRFETLAASTKWPDNGRWKLPVAQKSPTHACLRRDTRNECCEAARNSRAERTSFRR